MKASKRVIFDRAAADGGPYPPEHFAERPGTPPKVAEQFQETGKTADRGVGPLDCGDPVDWLIKKSGAGKVEDINLRLFDGAQKIWYWRHSATAEVLE